MERRARRRVGRPKSAAGARPAARLLHDRTVEQLSTGRAGRPARVVRRPGTVRPVLVAPTPPAVSADAVVRPATGPQKRARRLCARVHLGLRGHVGTRQTPRLKFSHQLLLFLSQKSGDESTTKYNERQLH